MRTTFQFLIREKGRADVVTVEAKTVNKAYKALKAARPNYGEAHVVTMHAPGLHLEAPWVYLPAMLP